jgi:hypothetical protein
MAVFHRRFFTTGIPVFARVNLQGLSTLVRLFFDTKKCQRQRTYLPFMPMPDLAAPPKGYLPVGSGFA